jgi:acyl-CoA reductase-like NAD-dependent aldehyde dehydrogenase
MAPSYDFTKFYNVIDGKTRDAKEHTNAYDPVKLKELWDVPCATKQDVDDAVVSAAKAYKTWSKKTIAERQKYLRATLDLYREYIPEFGKLLFTENGKPVSSG